MCTPTTSGREEIDGLAEHAGFRFDAADAPTDDAEAVDHGGVRVGSDQRVGIIKIAAAEHALGEILEIDLVHDADARRDEAESLERLLAPLEEFVTLAVALEFHVHVQLQRHGRAGEIDLDRVIDHEIDRDERLDDFRIAAQPFHRAAHGGEIDHQRDAGEILQDDPRDDERNFLVRRLLRVPVGQRLDIFAADFFAVAIAQDGFEHDPDADRQARDRADALFLERGERVERRLATQAGVELLECIEFVRHYFNSASLALILSKFGSSRASSSTSAYCTTPSRSMRKAERLATPAKPRLSCGRKES